MSGLPGKRMHAAHEGIFPVLRRAFSEFRVVCKWSVRLSGAFVPMSLQAVARDSFAYGTVAYAVWTSHKQGRAVV